MSEVEDGEGVYGFEDTSLYDSLSDYLLRMGSGKTIRPKGSLPYLSHDLSTSKMSVDDLGDALIERVRWYGHLKTQRQILDLAVPQAEENLTLAQDQMRLDYRSAGPRDVRDALVRAHPVVVKARRELLVIKARKKALTSDIERIWCEMDALKRVMDSKTRQRPQGKFMSEWNYPNAHRQPSQVPSYSDPDSQTTAPRRRPVPRPRKNND